MPDKKFVGYWHCGGAHPRAKCELCKQMLAKHKGPPKGYISLYDRWVKADKPDVQDFIKQHAAEQLKVLKGSRASEPEEPLDASADGRDWQPASQRSLREPERMCRFAHANKFEQVATHAESDPDTESESPTAAIPIVSAMKLISLNKLRKQ